MSAVPMPATAAPVVYSERDLVIRVSAALAAGAVVVPLFMFASLYALGYRVVDRESAEVAEMVRKMKAEEKAEKIALKFTLGK